MTDTASAAPAVSHEQSVVDALIDEYVLLHGLGGEKAPPRNADELHKRIHGLAEQRTALCLSGGGIRSASFGFGVMQALAEKGVLGKFHYLSTVSGGGYIGAWLTAWRDAVYQDESIPDARKEDVVLEGLAKRPAPAFREPFELTGIRANSNYLTPKLGALSADTWTLLALYVRNLLLNWLIYLPLFVALFLIPFGAVAVLGTATLWPDWLKDASIAATAVLMFTALVTSVRGRLGGTQIKRIAQGAFIRWELAPTYVAAMLLSIQVAGTRTPTVLGYTLDPVSCAVLGALFYGGAWLVAFLAFGSRERFATEGEHAKAQRVNAWYTDLKWSLRTEQDYWLLLAWILSGCVAGLLVGAGCLLATTYTGHPRVLAIFAVGWMAVSLFVAESVYLGLTSRSIRGDDEREWLARSSGWFLALTIVWALFAGLVLSAPTIRQLFDSAVSGLIATAAGMSVGAIAAKIGASAKTLVKTATQKPAVSVPMTKALALASVLFLGTIAIVISSRLPGLISRVQSWGPVKRCLHDLPEPVCHLLAVVAMVVVFGAFFGIFAWFVNVNRFSIHAMYRNRLIRAFLGSARGAGGQQSESRDPFTGFDTQDNLRYSTLVFPPRSNDPSAPRPRLFHVVNMALNVVSGTNNAWQERKAESFAATPLNVGNEYVGMHPTGTYSSIKGGLSLGTAMAISGAAASPNQGYHSSPLVGLVMTLFNVRLGWWLGNPANAAAAKQEGPRWGVFQLVEELFGLTTDASRYVYLSDGGHFENLGLYEMIRRRCRMIVVSDAGADPDCTFEDLGNAVRKIWIDFGVSIEFKKIEIGRRGSEPKPKLYYALGRITYPESPATDAYVLYVKPGFMNNGEEPADVAAYALANPTFPHETTADQFFTESQLESYRSLGHYTIKKILGEPVPMAGPDVPMEALRDYWRRIQSLPV